MEKMQNMRQNEKRLEQQFSPALFPISETKINLKCRVASQKMAFGWLEIYTNANGEKVSCKLNN